MAQDGSGIRALLIGSERDQNREESKQQGLKSRACAQGPDLPSFPSASITARPQEADGFGRSAVRNRTAWKLGASSRLCSEPTARIVRSLGRPVVEEDSGGMEEGGMGRGDSGEVVVGWIWAPAGRFESLGRPLMAAQAWVMAGRGEEKKRERTPVASPAASPAASPVEGDEEDVAGVREGGGGYGLLAWFESLGSSL